MTKVTLPRTNQIGANEWSDVESNDVAIQEVINGQLDNENIKASAGIVGSKLASGAALENLSASSVIAEKLAANAKPFTWYTPKIIATEESRENVAFGKLTTPDEITGVVLPENGLILIGYAALWKSSIAEAGKATIFLGANRLKYTIAAAPKEIETSTLTANSFGYLYSSVDAGIIGRTSSEAASFVTTGEIIGNNPEGTLARAGITTVFAAPNTYTVSVQYKATSGSVTAKERKLWVATLGF